MPSRPIFSTASKNAAPPVSTCWLYWIAPTAEFDKPPEPLLDERHLWQILPVEMEKVEGDEGQPAALPGDRRPDRAELMRAVIRVGGEQVTVQDGGAWQRHRGLDD